MPRTKEDRHPLRTLYEMLLVLAILWNVIVPALAEDGEAGPAPPLRLSEAGSGALLRKTPGGLAPLPILGLEVRLEVTGILVHGVVTQRFLNPTPDVIECVYVFPLPERAAVHRMEMRIGERRIVSIIREKEEARAIYEQARQEGHKAALLEQERPNLFTTSAANVNPGESVEIELEYLQETDYHDGEFGLTVPLTFTPRFLTNAAGDAERMGAPFARPGSAPFPRADLEVRIHPGFPIQTVESASHPILTHWDSDALVVEPEGRTVAADRDFQLRWRPLLAGACLLWFGWYGFNAGSEMRVDSVTATAFLNTDVAASFAARLNSCASSKVEIVGINPRSAMVDLSSGMEGPRMMIG